MNYVNLDLHQVTLQDFDILEVIAKSSDYSTVFKALDKRSGRFVALKMITVVDEKDLILLIQALQKEQHDWRLVCPVYGIFGEEGNAFIVMEYFAGGSMKDLLQLLQQDSQQLDLEVLQVILQQIVLAIQEVHDQNLIHQHIKSANILISANGQIKLSYFSPDKQFTDTLFKSKSHFLSLPYWLPPETIERSSFDQKGDIWALGITAFELITGKLPYENIPVQKVIFSIVQDPPPRLPQHYHKYTSKQITRDLQDFVELCLQKDPKKRPSARDLLQHNLIAQAKKKQLLYELFEKQTTIRLSLRQSKASEKTPEGDRAKPENVPAKSMHKRVRTSFRINSMGLLVAEGSQGALDQPESEVRADFQNIQT